MSRELIFTYWMKLIRLTFPILFSLAAVQAMEMIDLLMIGELGIIPVAAAAFVNGVVSIFLTVSIGFSASVSTLVARNRSEEGKKECSEIVHSAFWLNTLVSILFILLLELMRHNLHWFDQDPQVTQASRTYFLWIEISVLPQFLFQVHKQFSDGLGKTLHGGMAMLASLFLNVFLNWILIYGKLGFPALGLVGAGVGTFLARITLFAGYLLFLKRSIHYQGFSFHIWPFNTAVKKFRNLLAIGFPAGLQYLFEVGVFSASTIMAGWISPVALASHQIALKIATMCYMLPLSLSLAVSIEIGTAIGLKNVKSARHITVSTFLFSFVCMSVIAVALWGGRNHIPLWFIDSREVLRIASPLLVITALFQLFDGTQAVAIGVLRGMLDTKVPAILTFISYWMISLPLSWFLAFGLDLNLPGLWYGLMTGLICSAVLLNIRIIGMFAAPHKLH